MMDLFKVKDRSSLKSQEEHTQRTRVSWESNENNRHKENKRKSREE